MPLSQDQLVAFAAVVRAGNFTRAAAELHLSQPALSRRIANLEEQLAAVLLVRSAAGVTVTDAGRRVLDFVRSQQTLENDLMGDLSPSLDQHRGSIRIAGLSSIVPVLMLPDLARFLHQHPAVQLELRHIASEELAIALLQAATDYAISDVAAVPGSLVSLAVGEEEFVVIEGPLPPSRRDVYLDTSAADQTSEWFFAAQPARVRPRRWRRTFLDDEAGILLGVQLGVGRAVKPRHTIPAAAKVHVVGDFTPVRRKVFLQHRAARYQGRLHREVMAVLEGAVRRGLVQARR
jgi:DNA-binding transcriptional LysR family regulator